MLGFFPVKSLDSRDKIVYEKIKLAEICDAAKYICDNVTSAKISYVDFCAPVKSTKFWDFAAAMDNVLDVWFLPKQ